VAKNKSPDSPQQVSTVVTMVDLLVQDILFLHLAHQDYKFDFYSEELASIPEELKHLLQGCFTKDSRYLFFLDPIDGTIEYVNQGDKYSIMGGVLDKESGRVACSFIYFPATSTYYYAIRNKGVWVQIAPGQQRIMGVSTPSRLGRPMQLSVPRYKRLLDSDFRFFRERGLQPVAEPHHAGGALADAAIRGAYKLVVMRDFHGHDTAPASLFFEELGGGAFGEDGNPITFPVDMRRLPVVAFSHDKILARDAAMHK